jgi:hypothetical protein
MIPFIFFHCILTFLDFFLFRCPVKKAYGWDFMNALTPECFCSMSCKLVYCISENISTFFSGINYLRKLLPRVNKTRHETAYALRMGKSE